MTVGNIHRIALSIAAAAAMAASGTPVFADGPAPSPLSQARELAAEVLRQAGGGELVEWTRSVIGRALERAGDAASETAADTAAGGNGDEPPVPLPAERHAASVKAGLADRNGSAEILVFMSLSVPAASWERWAREAAPIGAPLVLRGVGPEGFGATVKEVGSRLGGAEAGVAIDPRLFRLFGVERVPALAVVPGGIAACESRGCADDPAPPHDLVTGNIGLAAALKAIALEGDAGRETARRVLERLNGEDRP